MNSTKENNKTEGVTVLPRRFKVDATVLEDPNPEMSPDEVIAFYAHHNPELTTGHFREPVIKDDAIEYTYDTKLGVKGSDIPAAPDFNLMEEVSDILLQNDDDIEAAPWQLLEIV